VTAKSECARGVVDRYEALPLLDSKRFGRIDAEADGFALRVKGIEVDVRNYAERRLRVVGLELMQLFICELRLGNATWGGDGELRRMEIWRW
jgi:hypothetical protein